MLPSGFWRPLHPCFVFRPDTFARALYRKLRPTPASCLVRTPWGDPLTVHPREFIGAQIYLRGLHELHVCELLSRLSHPGDRVIDVGANIGLMTSLLSHRVGPSGHVYAFEPHPVLFKTLRQNSQHWQRPHVQLLNCAASNRTGTRRLHEPRFFAQNAGTAAFTRSPGRHRTFEVSTVRLDDALPDADYAMLKIDVEGHEHEVLAGSIRSLSRRRIPNIVFESTARYPGPAHQLLLELGYNIYAITAAFSGPRLLDPPPPAAEQGITDYLATLDPQRAQRLIAPRGWNVLRRGEISRDFAKPLNPTNHEMAGIYLLL
jgi:FkbM family methyltransferase